MQMHVRRVKVLPGIAFGPAGEPPGGGHARMDPAGMMELVAADPLAAADDDGIPRGARLLVAEVLEPARHLDPSRHEPLE